jgi:hypothetical protein
MIMKTQNQCDIPAQTEKDWAETPREKEFMLGYIRAIPKRLGLTPEMIARHVVGVDKRDGLKHLYNQRVRSAMAIGRPAKCLELRSKQEKLNQELMNQTRKLADLCVQAASMTTGVPPEIIRSASRHRHILQARWISILATYRLMEFRSMKVLRLVFGISFDTVRHIRRESEKWPMSVKRNLESVVLSVSKAQKKAQETK